nr:MAG TPA: hypothetical protein [Caudoviricetes sp.]
MNVYVHNSLFNYIAAHKRKMVDDNITANIKPFGAFIFKYAPLLQSYILIVRIKMLPHCGNRIIAEYHTLIFVFNRFSDFFQYLFHFISKEISCEIQHIIAFIFDILAVVHSSYNNKRISFRSDNALFLDVLIECRLHCFLPSLSFICLWYLANLRSYLHTIKIERKRYRVLQVRRAVLITFIILGVGHGFLC